MGDILELNSRIAAVENFIALAIEKVPTLKQVAEEGGLIKKEAVEIEEPKQRPNAKQSIRL